MKLRQNTKSNTLCLYLLLAGILLLETNCTRTHSVINEEQVIMPTYPFSDPNPVPLIGNIYPYFRFDGFSDTSVSKTWKMVVMENDYIKLWITPEIGGKIWGAVEKSTGKEFIYYNHAVKFSDVAMRGPWTSGGIEINFGVMGHAPTCSTPVDYCIRKNEDGSSSCFVGAIDLPSRTRWSVEINLPKDRAYFTTRTIWDNPTSQEQSYYHWMNLGIKASGNLEYIFPGNYIIGHDGRHHPWPVDEKNRDLSFYDNNNFGSYKANHIFGELTNFYGAFWHKDNFGFGHYSPYDEKPGKKFWIWGLSGEGMIWEKLLTDKDGQYSELQSGRLFNQAEPKSSETPFKHRSFLPGVTDEFSEYWFPVKGTSGLKSATPDGSVNLRRNKNQCEIYFCPNKQIDGKLEVRGEKGKVIFSKSVHAAPMQTVKDSFEYNGNTKILDIFLNDKLLYCSNKEKSRIKRPVELFKNFNFETAYGHYMKGKEKERQRLYDASAEEYQKSLDIEPAFVPSLTGMAAIYYRKADYKHSLEYSLKSLSVDTYDGEGNMLYGTSSLALGDTASAIDGFSIAASSVSVRTAAYNALSSVFLCKKDYTKALYYADRSLMYNQIGSTALQIKLLCLRTLGEIKEEEKELKDMGKSDPLNHFINFERYLISPSSKSRNKATLTIVNELPYETYLEYALWYYRNGQKEDALKILKICPYSQPIVLLWQSYLSCMNGDKSSSDKLFQKMLKQSPEKVFPYRRETLKALEWAGEKSNDWKLNYYEGLIDIHLGEKEKGLKLLNDCGNMPDFYPFYIVRSKLWEEGDPRAEKDIIRSLEIGGKAWRAELCATEFYKGKDDIIKAERLARKAHKDHPDNYYIGLYYAKILDQNKEYQECINLLGKLVVMPNEGSTRGREIWRDANIGYALELIKRNKYKSVLKIINQAKQWPENLGVGRPYIVDERLEDFISLQCYKKLGDLNSSKLAQERIIDIREKDSLSYELNDFLSAWVLKKKGNKLKGDQFMRNLIKKNPSSVANRWCMAVYQGNNAKAGRIALEGNKDNREFYFIQKLSSELE